MFQLLQPCIVVVVDIPYEWVSSLDVVVARCVKVSSVLLLCGGGCGCGKVVNDKRKMYTIVYVQIKTGVCTKFYKVCTETGLELARSMVEEASY